MSTNHPPTKEDTMETMKIQIGGMSCGHCIGQVTKALSGAEGIVVQKVTVGEAIVSYDSAVTNPQAIETIIVEAGYEPQPAGRVQ
jgi:copper chaperone